MECQNNMEIIHKIIDIFKDFWIIRVGKMRVALKKIITISIHEYYLSKLGEIEVI